jgi:hypothetical protein
MKTGSTRKVRRLWNKFQNVSILHRVTIHRTVNKWEREREKKTRFITAKSKF